jgi:hypothetical protein
MTLIQRHFNYHDTIQVSTEGLVAAREGKKTCTVRLGTLGIDQDILLLTDGKDSLRIKVERIDSDRVLSQLTPDDARMDGANSLEDLTAALKHFYGDIDSGQPMTVIYFSAA